MRITEAGFTILPTPHTQAEILKHIERCGRVCYKSEDKITEDSAQQFVANIIKRGHEAVLEHGILRYQLSSGGLYLTPRINWYLQTIQRLHNATGYHSYLRFTADSGRVLMSGNVRAWRDFLKAYVQTFREISKELRTVIVENPDFFPELLSPQIVRRCSDWHGRMVRVDFTPEQICAEDRLEHQDVSVLFTVDRGISHEIVRHRPASYCQESTRYCDYSAGRFGGEITVIEPKALRHTPGYKIWMDSCKRAETAYFDLLDCGCSPQEARGVLPNSLKTEIVMTANLAEWRHFFQLRTSRAAHPQMREVAIPLLREFKKRDPESFCDIREDKA